METNGKQEKKTKGISHIQIINIVQKVWQNLHLQSHWKIWILFDIIIKANNRKECW